VSYDFRVVVTTMLRAGATAAGDGRRQPAIDGATIAENLFPNGNALGQQFKARARR
jgi:putative ABC transport system permease protein